MKRLILAIHIIIVIVFGLSSTAQSTLINRGTDILGNQLIYDTDFDITWYDFSIHDTWQGSIDWADALAVDFGGNIYDDWRLPIADPTCGTEINCTGSEMGHLYYTELGNLADGAHGIPLITDFTDGLTGTSESFLNLLDSYYWSGTVYDTEPHKSWFFLFNYGYHFQGSKESAIYALAVREGDVASVPEPSTFLLLFSGLFGLAICRKSIRLVREKS